MTWRLSLFTNVESCLKEARGIRDVSVGLTQRALPNKRGGGIRSVAAAAEVDLTRTDRTVKKEGGNLFSSPPIPSAIRFSIMRQGRRRREGGFFRSHRLLHCCGRRLLLPRRGEGVRPPQPHFMVCLPSFYFWSCFPFFCCNEACLLLRCKRRASWKKRPLLLRIFSAPLRYFSLLYTFLPHPILSSLPEKSLPSLGQKPPLHKGTISPSLRRNCIEAALRTMASVRRGGREGEGGAVAKVRKTPFRTTFFGPLPLFQFSTLPPFSFPPSPSDRFLSSRLKLACQSFPFPPYPPPLSPPPQKPQSDFCTKQLELRNWRPAFHIAHAAATLCCSLQVLGLGQTLGPGAAWRRGGGDAPYFWYKNASSPPSPFSLVPSSTRRRGKRQYRPPPFRSPTVSKLRLRDTACRAHAEREGPLFPPPTFEGAVAIEAERSRRYIRRHLEKGHSFRD